MSMISGILDIYYWTEQYHATTTGTVGTTYYYFTNIYVPMQVLLLAASASITRVPASIWVFVPGEEVGDGWVGK